LLDLILFLPNKKKFMMKLFLFLVGFMGTSIWPGKELKKVLGKSTRVIDLASIVKPSGKTHIKNVNVLSEDCSYFMKNQDVIILDGVILGVGENLISDSSSMILDGTNKFLMPGLIDSHVHIKESKNDLYLYLANGVTYVREMAGRPIVLEWRKEIQKNGIGPRMFIASPPIYTEPGLKGLFYAWSRQSVNYSKKGQAEKKIKKIGEQGYDAIKMYGFVNPEMFKTTIEIAKQNNIPVIGHIPLVSLDTFYSAGQKEIAHIEELTKKSMEDFGKSISRNSAEYLNFLTAHSGQIAKKLKANDICVTSTISFIESLPKQRFDLKSHLKTIALKYVNPKIIEGTYLYKLGWLPSRNGFEYDGKDEPEARNRSFTYWETYVTAIHIMTKALVDNKVTIMAGTDANVATVVPGFSLHDELASLSQLGMTNAEVLYSATVAPSNWMKSITGKIKVGYHSDLILLSKNPLEDIKNTKTVEYVFFGKYMIDKTQIKTILKNIEDANNENRKVKIDEYLY
jgi:predicted metal-dependent TIM-barrel fold hydrolase